MRILPRIRYVSPLGVAFLLGWLPPSLFAQPQTAHRAARPATAFVPGKIIVKFKPAAAARAATPGQAPALAARTAALLQANGLLAMAPAFTIIDPADPAEAELARIYELRFPASQPLQTVVQLLRKQKNIAYVERVPVRMPVFTPDDPELARQSHLAEIHAFEAWDITRGSEAVLIAIVDTGVDWEHPDLAANIWQNPGEFPDNGIDDDGNGFIDDIHGWDFGGHDNNPKNIGTAAPPSHGTHVAGIAAAATDNGTGIAGVGFRCKILPVKATLDALDDPGQSIIFGFQGIKYAADLGADVINLSWGGVGESRLEEEIIAYAARKGAVIVAAAGNNNSNQKFFPAAYSQVMSVANTFNGRKANSSSFGMWLDIAAPGTSIFSTWPENDYRVNSGTSMAAPVISGAAALVKSVHPDWRPEAIIEQLRQTADNIDSLNANFHRQLGKGRVNLLRALTESPPGPRLISYRFSDANGGDGDGVLEPGETVELWWSATNYLAAISNLTVQLNITDPVIQVINGNIAVPGIATDDTVTAPEPFIFSIAPDTPAGHLLDVIIEFSAPNFDDYHALSAWIRPLFQNIVVGNVATTISSFGAIGFSDYANTRRSIGLGFQFPGGSESALFHGSFMIATSAAAVSDAAYGNVNQDRYDFRILDDGDIRVGPGPFSDLEATLRFSDLDADAPNGFEIQQKIFGWDAPPNDNFIVLEYSITNTSGTAYDSVYAALYLDWDVVDPITNRVRHDPELQLSYMLADSSKKYGVTAVTLSEPFRLQAINNPQFIWSTHFPDAIKYRFMSGELSRLEGPEPDDWSIMASFGPFALPQGSAKKVAFALVAGFTDADIKNSARAVRTLYRTVDVPAAVSETPLTFALLQSAPNPFSLQAGRPGTTIAFRAGSASRTSLKIYNILGQEVKTLFLQDVGGGQMRKVRWDGTDATGRIVAPGVYFYRLISGMNRQTRKILVIR